MDDFETTVLGGLPVTIAYRTTGHDNRDVGCGVDDLDEWEIIAVNGKPIKDDSWIMRRLSKADRQEIELECLAHRPYRGFVEER